MADGLVFPCRAQNDYRNATSVGAEEAIYTRIYLAHLWQGLGMYLLEQQRKGRRDWSSRHSSTLHTAFIS